MGAFKPLNFNKVAIPGGEASLSEADNSLSRGGRESEEEHIGDRHRRNTRHGRNVTYTDGEVEKGKELRDEV